MKIPSHWYCTGWLAILLASALSEGVVSFVYTALKAASPGLKCCVSGECFGKAGAYGAQGPAGVWIQSLKGCYFNVMGLPLHDLASAISELLLRDL